MKVNLDSFYLGVVINGLYKYQHCCEGKTGFSDFLLRLVNQYEDLKPGRNKEDCFSAGRNQVYPYLPDGLA